MREREREREREGDRQTDRQTDREEMKKKLVSQWVNYRSFGFDIIPNKILQLILNSYSSFYFNYEMEHQWNFHFSLQMVSLCTYLQG